MEKRNSHRPGTNQGTRNATPTLDHPNGAQELQPDATASNSDTIASLSNVAPQIEILGEIESAQTMASGPSLRVRSALDKLYGKARWRKRKGTAVIRLPDGWVGRAEVHWYEAHGRGRVNFKIKRLLKE